MATLLNLTDIANNDIVIYNTEPIVKHTPAKIDAADLSIIISDGSEVVTPPPTPTPSTSMYWS